MHLLVLIGVLFFSSYALALLGKAAFKPKPAPPDAFQQPTVPAGTAIPIVFGTFRVRPIMVGLYKTKLVESKITSNVAFGLPLGEVAIVPSGTIGRTTSGKVQRSATRLRYLRGEFLAVS